MPSPEQALAFLEQDARQDELPRSDRRGVVGSPETVRAGLQEIADGYGAQELIAVNIVYEHAARMRSYELLAQALEL